MKQRSTALSFLAALLVVASLAGTAFTQDPTDTLPAHPRYARLIPHLRNDIAPPATALTTWNGSFAYSGHTYKYNMVGTNPSTGVSTTVPVFLIPIALQYKSGTTTTTFSPAHVLSNGQTVTANTVASPMFVSGIDFNQGGTDLGTTQYIDAFQRGNFWSHVSKAPGYHLLLGTPRVAPVQTIVVPAADGSVATEFGVKVGLADINWFDAQIQALITKFTAIQPNTLPIFITYDAYLTSGGGCCIGGYHSSMGSTATPQAYAHFTYVDRPVFSQNVSALSHEVGEWADDPLVVNVNGNPVVCGILEVGDPEEGFTNFGGFPYTLGGFTYTLQDLVWLPYFGASATTSANGWETFQGNPFHLGICNNGG
jgi:hypothetical protein